MYSPTPQEPLSSPTPLHTSLQDPFPKPCYLFALVAGALVMKEDAFTTSSGRRVALRIFTQPANISQVRAGR